MRSAIIKSFLAAIALGIYAVAVGTNACSDAALQTFPLTMNLLLSALRYFIAGAALSCVLGLIYRHSQGPKPIWFWALSLISIICVGALTCHMRQEIVLMSTPSLLLLPGTFLGWEIVS